MNLWVHYMMCTRGHNPEGTASLENDTLAQPPPLLQTDLQTAICTFKANTGSRQRLSKPHIQRLSRARTSNPTWSIDIPLPELHTPENLKRGWGVRVMTYYP